MKAIFTLALGAWLVVLGGCNTMEGLGKDLQQLGQKIEKKAQ
jgi:predicted small secreted protein